MNPELLPWHKADPARLVIADDHELVRAGLRMMLTGQWGLEVVGEAANGHEALALCRRLQPDLALIDVRMPDMDGLAVCRAIKPGAVRPSSRTWPLGSTTAVCSSA